MCQQLSEDPTAAQQPLAPVILDRLAAAANYILPDPFKGLALRGRGEFVRHHYYQAAGISFLLVCVALFWLLLLLIGTGVYLSWERTADQIHLQDWIRRLAIGSVSIWLISWLLGIVLAAIGSQRRLPLAAGFGSRKWTRRLGIFGAMTLGLVAVFLAAMALFAQAHARPLDRAPASLYLLYDETQAPRWVVILLAFPMNRAADQRWGAGSAVVAPISRESLRVALAHGKVVYLATHGVNGPLLYRQGSLCPRDISEGMTVGQELRLVYLAACHGGDLAQQWETVLAPARVVSYPRFSAYLEHAYWLWIKLPRFIADQT